MKTRVSNFAKNLTLCMLVANSWARPGFAETITGDFEIRGIGIARCDALVKALDGVNSAAVNSRLIDWVSGYITASNLAAKDTFNLVPLSNDGALSALLVGVCKSNPQIVVLTALRALIDKFQPLTLHAQSELLTLTVRGVSVPIRSEGLANVQAILTADGFMKPAETPGKFDSATQEGLEKYQGEHSLPKTGLPDDRTILMILSSK